jgi:hypothetical protein
MRRYWDNRLRDKNDGGGRFIPTAAELLISSLFQSVPNFCFFSSFEPSLASCGFADFRFLKMRQSLEFSRLPGVSAGSC